MNNNSYAMCAFLCMTAIFLLVVFILASRNAKGYKTRIALISLELAGILFFASLSAICIVKHRNSYREVYYLEYTIYYPGSPTVYKVDSCNRIDCYSNRGTNRISYYSIPHKDRFGVNTSAPIQINKIIKR